MKPLEHPHKKTKTSTPQNGRKPAMETTMKHHRRKPPPQNTINAEREFTINFQDVREEDDYWKEEAKQQEKQKDQEGILMPERYMHQAGPNLMIPTERRSRNRARNDGPSR